MRDYTPRPKPEKQVKPKKGLNRIPTARQKQSIADSKKYYKIAIASNIAQNRGKCTCENCGKHIKEPTGSNVSHIVSKGSNRELYLDPDNHFILCDICEGHWTMHDKTQMAIYNESEERRIALTFKYYNK